MRHFIAALSCSLATAPMALAEETTAPATQGETAPARQTQGVNDPTKEVRAACTDTELYRRTRFTEGRLEPRECELQFLVDADQSYDVGDVAYIADRLARRYELRADRQQRFTDVGAGVTFTTALGAGLSGAAGQVTQRAWLGAAFVPILLSQQNAYEPTRDLYHAGAIGLRFITQRYETLQSRADALGTEPGAVDCSKATRVLSAVATWAPGDDRDALLPEARRLWEACDALRLNGAAADLARRSIDNAKKHWAADYANDVLLLDQALLEQDRDFRYSSSETIMLMLAAPFRTIDNLLTGEDSDSALKKIQATVAFDGISQRLAAFSLPEAPQAITPLAPLSRDILNRLSATRPAANAQIMRDTVLELQAIWLQVSTHQIALAHDVRMINEIYAAAAHTDLRFNYSAASGAVTVQLTPPAPPQRSAPTPPSAEAPASP